jgi:hypothetical protein
VNRLLVAAGAAGIALLCGVGYAGYVGYDATFALIWGRELASFDAPSFEDPWAPTPHPLMNLAGALVSPLGAEAAAAALEVVALASLVLLAVAAFRLGAALFSAAAGFVAAAILVTRPEIVELALFAQFDVLFLALVALAAALAAERSRDGPPSATLGAERPREGAPPATLGPSDAPLLPLALAGLLRPEAWLLAGAYALWRRTPRAFALAAAGPLLWLLHDLVLTGDPIFSFHGTREFAERHQPGNGLGDAFRLAPEFVTDVTGVVVALGGVAGWLLVPRVSQRRVALPAALFGLAIAAFVVYGAAGLTLYARFLLPAAAALAALCAAAATGWERDRLDAPRRAAAIAVAAALLVSLPFTSSDLADIRDKSAERARLEAALVDVFEHHPPGCEVVYAPSYRIVPPLLHRLDLPGERFTEHPPRGRPALHITVPQRAFVVEQLELDPVPPEARRAPPGAETIVATSDWHLSADC